MSKYSDFSGFPPIKLSSEFQIEGAKARLKLGKAKRIEIENATDYTFIQDGNTIYVVDQQS